MWGKKQEKAFSVSNDGQKKENSFQWSKYTVMKRRTENLLDIAERKGALRQGFSGARPQKI